jgi:partner of Y14 and mago protein
MDVENLFIFPETKVASSSGAQPASNSSSDASDPRKKLRNLKKKLSDIESLQSRLDSGDLKNPEPEQLEKLNRRDQVEAEIRELEALLKKL